ncbi:anaerobic C4-dicarboxylate transporter [Brevibacterium aurantiacum]|uniref:C4-dicarboxylate ABC transporter n=1 Tax=Brevibacterium aurantiacum TaxID=273384 RepID=A0A3T0DCR4_BREAU|nr:anaerobic C4-dicarboxylate transporter family protein [Brevibacterium aurantiacum]AZT93041.1 C4-dicarboxylate ABC transporter [Brevibacterium aurantiacum]MDN5587342.1 anaerobic C4-dicarboxylate transporter family protein [Brevibacterium sp.]TGD36313.1 C4-dicarboxylate ABC transporter [Brevibacterium aurantiacum]
MFLLELAVVILAILMGTRSSGVGLGLWGGTGVAVLVFGFQLAPGAIPLSAIIIVLAVVLSASVMQQAGGIDWMVSIAAKAISKNPKMITFVAPLIAFLFSVGAGTSNILYPLLPVIKDVAYQNGIRPSRPLSLSVVATGVALAASPVSAAMAAMIGFTSAYGFELINIVMVTLPAAVIGIILTAFVVNKLGKDLADDPEVQAKIAAGEIPAPGGAAAQADQARVAKLEARGKTAQAAKAASKAPTADAAAPLPEPTVAGRNAALLFFSGVLAIVVFGLFPGFRPPFGAETTMGMSELIPVIMFVVGTLIILVARPKVSEIPTSSVFKAGMVSAIALFGLAWLTSTFLDAHADVIRDGVGGLILQAPWVFALGVFLVCVLTTSQSTATNTAVPIALAAGMPLGLLSGMWAGAFAGIYLLPTNGSQIAAANFDTSGSTKLGTKLVDHSFFVPTLVLAVTTIAAGSVIGLLTGMF